jgi:glycerol uptake facilitator-like aquaporin
MISACVFTVLLFDPAVARIPNPWAARALMGVAMGLTAVAIIKSPMGKASGVHFNPAITLTFTGWERSGHMTLRSTWCFNFSAESREFG